MIVTVSADEDDGFEFPSSILYYFNKQTKDAGSFSLPFGLNRTTMNEAKSREWVKI
jgi:hypothetical protein